MRRLGRSLRLALLAALLAPALYLFAAVIGALVPRNPGWREPQGGVPIFVRSNGVHVDLVLPASAAGVELYRVVPPRDIADPRFAQGWVAIGWGQRELYLETPYWRDLTLRNALRATFGGRALMHVEHMARPQPGPDMRPLRLDPAAYRELTAAMLADFTRGGDGAPILLPGRGYGDEDAFYEADGHYTGLRTCNQWTADALARAGVRVGAWTPFAQGVLRSL